MHQQPIRLLAAGVAITALVILATQPSKARAEEAKCTDGKANEGCLECDPGGSCSFSHPGFKSNGSANSWTCEVSAGDHCQHGVANYVDWKTEDE